MFMYLFIQSLRLQAVCIIRGVPVLAVPDGFFLISIHNAVSLPYIHPRLTYRVGIMYTSDRLEFDSLYHASRRQSVAGLNRALLILFSKGYSVYSYSSDAYSLELW